MLSAVKINKSSKKWNIIGLYPAVVLMCGKSSLRLPSMKIQAHE